MPKYIISNRVAFNKEHGSMTDIFSRYGKPEDPDESYYKKTYFGHDIRVMMVASADNWDFFLDTQEGVRPITNYFDAAWLSHFAIYDLYLRCKFDEYLRKY